MTDMSWIATTLTASRPRAVAALLRYFRDLDTAEEAFQEASLRALQHWPDNGPPRDPLAWLIFVGRNAALDEVRRRKLHDALPEDEAAISDLDDAEARLVEQLDQAHYRDDVLRLLFVCCHPELPLTQQIALALRIVSGLSVQEIARAFLVGESAMEQRITRAKAKVAEAGTPFEVPGAIERRQGCFELADRGTLFLDEIAEMSAATQVKLLRVLQERMFRRLGGRQEQSVDIRVIAETNLDVASAIESGRLRDALRSIFP